MGIIVIIWWLKLNWPKENFYHFFKDKQKWLILSHVSLSVLISFLISQLIGLLYFRPRPFISNFQVVNDINPLSEKSFPSDHTTIAFALAAAVYCSHKKLGIFLLILAFLVGFGRIYTGVHYPLDVLGGILVGIISALLVYYLFRSKK